MKQRTRQMKRSILLFFCAVGLALHTWAGNVITVDKVGCDPNKKPLFQIDAPNMDNTSGRTCIDILIKSVQTPFEIYKIEWFNCGAPVNMSEPFTLSVPTDSIKGMEGTWKVQLDFDYRKVFSEKDEIRIYSDQGIFKIPTSVQGKHNRKIQLLQQDYEEKLNISQSGSDHAWFLLTALLCGVIIASVAIGVSIRRWVLAKQKQLEKMTILITERNTHNHELQKKVDELYHSRLDTLNMLCNEYFEKNDSEKIRLTLYNEVERHILHLRDKKSLEELEAAVNTYLDNIMAKVRQQLPEMKTTDLNFLIYLFAGFSPRAICIFTDIKIKNFYNRRSRLKERILASDAPDREWFVSKM